MFPSSGDSALIADTQPRDITIRDEIDRTIQSVGWMFDTDRKGRMRVRTWPHQPEGVPLVVVDCFADVPGHPLDPTSLVAHSIVYSNDESQLLNHVVTSNGAQPASTVTVEETPSISRFGKRGRALDYPKGGLAWASTTDAAVWARRVLNRFAYITRHIESFEVDTLLDPDWLSTLADAGHGSSGDGRTPRARPVVHDGRRYHRVAVSHRSGTMDRDAVPDHDNDEHVRND